MTKLIIEHLNKCYTKRTRNPIHALVDISVELSSDNVYGLLGQNGSGKTTFIKACTNLITYEGHIFLDESRKKGLSYRDYSAVLEGNRNMYWKLTVDENVRFFTGLRGLSFIQIRSKYESLLKNLDLSEKKYKLVETLSRGMQQKVAIMCALLSDAPLIFLDEPTLGLDVESKRQLQQFLKNNDFLSDRILLVTSHDMEFIRTLSSNHLFLRTGHLSPIDLNQIKKSMYTIKVHTYGTLPLINGMIKSAVISNDDGECEITVDSSESSLSTLIQTLEEKGIEIYEVKQLNRDLENIYLDYSNGDVKEI